VAAIAALTAGSRRAVTEKNAPWRRIAQQAPALQNAESMRTTIRPVHPATRAVVTASAANDAAPPRSRVLPVTGAACGVTAAAPLSPEDIALVCDAAGLLHLRWQADLAGERMRALGQAWPHIREAVLHLAGHVSGAKRVAAVVRPALADVVRVYLTDGPAEARDQIAGLCEAACHGRAGSSPARSSGATSSS